MTISVNRPRNFVPLDDKRQRDEAVKLAASGSGSSKILVLPLEERRAFKEEALRIAQAPLKKLSAQEVWQGTVNRVAGMREEAQQAMFQILPKAILAYTTNADAKTTAIRSVEKSPHGGITVIAMIADDRGREIRIYGGNIDGTVKVDKKTGTPFLVDVKPPSEETQKEARYFAVGAQKLPKGGRDFSEQLVVSNTNDINHLLKRLCEVNGFPAPTKQYVMKKDRQPVASAAPAKPSALQRQVPSHEAHARSLWTRSSEPRRDMTIAEMRAKGIPLQPVQQREPRQAFAM